jgi:hypothetical protein
MKQQNSGGAVEADSWEYRAGSSPHFQGQIYDEAGKTVAISYDDEGGNKARLIASAPDLAEALHRIANGIENGQSFSGSNCRDIARAALTKAGVAL